MKTYICPICDHAMKGRYYCWNCHEFIKNPYYMEINYSLDRAIVKSDEDTEIELNNKKNTIQPRKAKTVQKAKKRHYHILWLFLIYILFQIGIALYSKIPETTIGKIKSKVERIFPEKKQVKDVEDMELGEGNEIEFSSDWSYETPDYNEIITKGEESTGLTHFAIDGKEFTEEIHQILNDSDFDVIENAEHMENYIAFNAEQSEKYSYFECIETFYLTEDFMEYYRISKDSVSGRLINTEVESADFDQVCFFIRAAASLLFPDNKRKPKRVEKLNNYLERLLGEETYFSERIGTMIISGYTYTNQNKTRDKMAFHISLSSAENE